MSFEGRVRDFLNSFGDDPIEERVCDFVVEEIGKGRQLADVLDDPYVKNRINEERRLSILQNCDVVDAVEDEILAAFGRLDEESPKE